MKENEYQIIEGGITAPQGFEAASHAAGIKYEGRDDMALIYTTTPAVSAGVYTQNVVKAAPVLWDRAITENESKVSAVIINSGIANACTGEPGMNICEQTAQAVASAVNGQKNQVLVASTGVIGMQIDVEKIVAGSKALLLKKQPTKEAGTQAAQAIMTTDTHKKEIAVTFELDGKSICLGAMCKGSGMIHPNMCTMLGFVTTDAAIEKKALQKALSTVVTDTFNMISVDGDTSTNDTLVVLANGNAGNTVITEDSAAYQTFEKILHMVCEYLAKQMAGDGEGATALVEATVMNAKCKEDARLMAKSIICSSLTKAAIFGHDANFGRILCAMGYSGAIFDQNKVEMYYESNAGRILIFNNGVAADYSEEEATKILSEPEVRILADMHEGDATATAWGCDLSYDYVKINADYRS